MKFTVCADFLLHVLGVVAAFPAADSRVLAVPASKVDLRYFFVNFRKTGNSRYFCKNDRIYRKIAPSVRGLPEIHRFLKLPKHWFGPTLIGYFRPPREGIRHLALNPLEQL